MVRAEVAKKQQAADVTPPAGATAGASDGAGTAEQPGRGVAGTGVTSPLAAAKPKRFHGSVTLDPTRVGRDAGRIADEVIVHLAGLVGSRVKVTLEIEAEIPSGTPDPVVRTVTENSRTLKFVSHGFEAE